MLTIVWLGNLKGRDLTEDVGVGGRIILEWNLRKLRCDFIWLRIRTNGGSLVNAVMNLWVP